MPHEVPHRRKEEKDLEKEVERAKAEEKDSARKDLANEAKEKAKYPSKGYGKKGYGKKGSWSWYNASPYEKKGLDISDGIPDGSSTMRQHLTSSVFGCPTSYHLHLIVGRGTTFGDQDTS